MKIKKKSVRRKQKKNGKWAPAPKDTGNTETESPRLPARERDTRDYDVPHTITFKEFPTSLCKSNLQNFHLEKLLVYFTSNISLMQRKTKLSIFLAEYPPILYSL